MPRFGHSRDARVRHGRDIARCKAQGRKGQSKSFLFLAVPTTRERSRLAVTVTTKVHKRSVVRNRIKRFAREAFRKMAPEITEPTDLLAIARFDAVQSSYQDVEADLRRALRSLKLIRST